MLPRRISGTCALHQRKLRDGDHARAPARVDAVRDRLGGQSMEIILRDHVDHLGTAARSSRSPTATPATTCCPASWPCWPPTGNRKRVERERKIAEAREAEERAASPKRSPTRLAALEIAIARKVGDTEQLYGSVTSRRHRGVPSRPRASRSIGARSCCPTPIKALGEHGAGQAAPRRHGAAEGDGRQGVACRGLTRGPSACLRSPRCGRVRDAPGRCLFIATLNSARGVYRRVAA